MNLAVSLCFGVCLGDTMIIASLRIFYHWRVRFHPCTLLEEMLEQKELEDYIPVLSVSFAVQSENRSAIYKVVCQKKNVRNW